MQLIHGLRFDNLRGDIFGGLTAAVVALPLALAFGVASGAGAIAGLYGAILVGFFAAVFGGTPSQVSGPTGPMTVVMAAVIMEFAHQPALAFTVVMLGGALQIAFGLLRLGRYVAYVPFPVISGFMSGIGCIIIILQLRPFLGHASSQDGVIAAIGGIGEAISAPGVDALIVGLVALAISIFWPARLRKMAPPPLMALVIASLFAAFALLEAPVIGNIPQGLPDPAWPMMTLADLPAMIRGAFVLAVLGTIDSLLTSLIADNVTRTQHQPNRELIGQGIGNIFAGLMGAIPGAGATMRTVINVRAGGRTPISGALHAVVLLALVLGLAPLAEQIPHAVLAGILLKVGWDIIDWDYVKRLRGAPLGGTIVMLTVLVLTVFVDLITAVAVGIIMKSLISADAIGRQQVAQVRSLTGDDHASSMSEEEAQLFEKTNGRVLLFRLEGAFSFASTRELTHKLSAIDGDYPVVLFDLARVEVLDTSVVMALKEVIHRLRDAGHEVMISGVETPCGAMMRRLKVLDEIPEACQFPDLATAIRALTPQGG